MDKAFAIERQMMKSYKHKHNNIQLADLYVIDNNNITLSDKHKSIKFVDQFTNTSIEHKDNIILYDKSVKHKDNITLHNVSDQYKDNIILHDASVRHKDNIILHDASVQHKNNIIPLDKQKHDQEIQFTDVSFFYKLDTQPKLPFNKLFPLVVFVNKDKIERVVSNSIASDINNIPGWILHPINYYKFKYYIDRNNILTSNSKRTIIECTYYKEKSILACTGIKYNCIDMFEQTKEELFYHLNVTNVSYYGAFYKASCTIQIFKPWNKDVLAYIITNDHTVSNTIAVQEYINTLGSKHIFPIVIKLSNKNVYVRAVLKKINNKDILSVKLSKLPDHNCAYDIMSNLQILFKQYNKLYYKIKDLYIINSEDDISIDVNKIQKITKSNIFTLRSEVPDFFISNYTRECPMLPIIITEEEAIECKNNNIRVIYYPKKNGRYYVAPEGYYVGLKKNRLSNKDVYPFLVTCYMTDHMLKPNSETYNYYVHNDSKKTVKKIRNRPVPRLVSMMQYNYHRVCLDKTKNGFIHTLEKTLDVVINVEKLEWAPYLVRQEIWDEDDDTIMKIIKGNLTENEYIPGSLVYRYFEEILQVSIHIIVIKDGVFDTLIPRHVNEYIWEQSYHKHIILFENIKKTYGKNNIFYDVLVKNNISVFDNNNEIVQYIIQEKKGMSIAPTVTNVTNAKKQYIDKDGKCRMIITNQDEEIYVLSRPLYIPTIYQLDSFFYEQTSEVNQIRSQLNINTIDTDIMSNHYLKYFPNDDSFKLWIKLQTQK